MAISKYQMMIGLFIFNFFLFPMIALTIQIPNVNNPIGDLFPGFSQGASGTGAGTCNSSISSCPTLTGDNVAPQTQNIQSCLVGIGTGALVGGLVGLGVGSAFTAVGGAVLAGIAGCGIASTFFPSQGSGLYQYIASNSGPLGDFTNALVTAMSWVGPVLKFFQDAVAYEFALLIAAPEIGAFLFPFQAMEAIMLIFVGAEYIRGTGIGA